MGRIPGGRSDRTAQVVKPGATGGAGQPTVFSGLISFYPQGPRDRRDHQGLQVPQAPKVTGARQERRAQRVLLVRTHPHTHPDPTLSTGGRELGFLPCLSRRGIPDTPFLAGANDCRLGGLQAHFLPLPPLRQPHPKHRRAPSRPGLWEEKASGVVGAGFRGGSWGLGVVLSRVNNTSRDHPAPPGLCQGRYTGLAQAGCHPRRPFPRAEVPGAGRGHLAGAPTASVAPASLTSHPAAPGPLCTGLGRGSHVISSRKSPPGCPWAWRPPPALASPVPFRVCFSSLLHQPRGPALL